MEEELRMFIPITKIEEAKRLIYGTVTEELADKSGETFDYASSKPFFQEWSDEISKATDGKSVGNLRTMHTHKVAGKLTQLDMNDAEKKITCVAKVLDDAEWAMCLEGAYTGFSQGGRYMRRWEQDGVKRYTAKPVEVSLVDSPCLSSARFELVKVDGEVEVRDFKKKEPVETNTEEPNNVEKKELTPQEMWDMRNRVVEPKIIVTR